MVGERGCHRRVMSVRHHVVVVEKMHEAANGVRPRQVAHNAGNTAGWLRVSQIGHPWVVQLVHHGPGATVRTVVDDQDFQCHALLALHARDRFGQFAVTSKGRDDHGKFHRIEIVSHYPPPQRLAR